MVLRRSGWARALAFICFVLVAQPASALPSGFAEEPVASGWNAVVGITFDANGNLYAWEKAGRVWIVHPDGTRHPTPLIDIREEVGDWRDYGLVGFALDPDFLTNGYIYLSYVVDRHHLLHFGTPSYDPAANEYFAATIGRITRYTANAADDFETVDYGSRLVLVGETKSTGFPMLYQSHGVGALVFGSDGTLLASCGDGASFETVDNGGSDGNAYGPQALADGIITTKENVGAFRAQLLSSLSGKILRLDPATGNGLPSNPYYDGAAPRSARSRVWSLGYRNPYRMTLRPGTGEHDPAAGNPGVFYVGDVGWDTWEDIDVVTGPAQNMGWPIFEGMTLVQGYFDAKTANLDAPNPLHGTGGCNKPYFDFQDLLVQDDLSPSWPNPCNGAQQVPPAYRQLHRRPAIDYRHGSGPARTGSYAGNGDATTINLGSASSPVAGEGFGGNTSTAGVFYTGASYPVAYQGKYFHGDYGSNWIRTLEFDAAHAPLAVERFIDSGRHPVAFAIDPLSGDVFYVDYGSQVIRLRFVGDGDLPPVAVAAVEREYGARPLVVRFFGDGSTDPEGGPLDYLWNFGDGVTSTLQNPIHTFVPAGPGPVSYDVQLTVTDTLGKTDAAAVHVAVDDTPPIVALTSPVDGATYSMSGESPLLVSSTVSDAQDPPQALSCLTQVYFHHNDHVHPEPEVYACGTTTMTNPLGCDGILYYYRATLAVTDSSGLTSRAEANVYPACSGTTLVARAGPDVVVTDAARDGGQTVLLDGTASSDAAHPIVSYAWRMDEATFAEGATASRRFPLGTTVVTLVVKNDVDAIAVDTVRVTVLPGNGSLAVPEARFRLTPENGLAPLPVAFDGTQSTDPDGTVTSWFWSFGDGSFALGPTASHVYASPGTYTATLSVLDDDGLLDTEAHTVRVEGPQLVVHLALDEGSGTAAVDDSGRGNHGTLVSGPTWIAGTSAGALSLDGTNDRVEIPPAASLDLRTGLTLAAWVRRDTAAAGGILVKGQTKVPYGLTLQGDGRLRFVANASGPVGGVGAGSWTSSGSIAPGGWHHAAVTYDGVHVRFYLDGALDPVHPAVTLVLGRIAEPLFAGADLYSGTFLDGALDDLRVANWALPSSAIDELASGGAGLQYAYFEGSWTTLPNFDTLPVLEAGTVANVSLAPRNRDDYFGFRFRGCIEIPSAETYTFFTTSDDGSKLTIGSTVVVNNDGLHAVQERSGTIALAAGLHPYTVTYFEGDIAEVLETRWQGPGFAKQTIPDGALFQDGCDDGPNRRPLAAGDTIQVAVEGQGQAAVLANDTDPDGDTLQLVRVEPALHGTVTRVGSTATYVHDGSANLVDAFEYKIADGHGATARGIVQVRACTTSDATCDGIDDDCDGSVDENGALPGEATGILFAADPQNATLLWSAPAFPGGSPLTYDVIRSGNPASFGAGAVCIESNAGADTAAVDPAVPAPGQLFAYVVRAANPCGEGSAGNRSNGTPRTVRTCP